jgi:hypothetical protein
MTENDIIIESPADSTEQNNHLMKQIEALDAKVKDLERKYYQLVASISSDWS